MEIRRIVQDAIYNYDELIDLLYECDMRFAFSCRIQVDCGIKKFIDGLLNFEAHMLLKDSFIYYKEGTRYGNEKLVWIYFKIDDNSKKWLKKHEGILVFNDFYSRLSYMPQVETMAYKNKWELYCPSFVDKDGNPVIYFGETPDQIDISNRYIDVFETWKNKILKNKMDSYQAFAAEFLMAVRNDEKNIVERFSSEDFPVFLYLKAFDNFSIRRSGLDEYEYLGLDDFYRDKKNILLFVKIVIAKLKKEFVFTTALRLFDIYNCIDDVLLFEVNKFLCGLEDSIFISLFNCALINRFQHLDRKDLTNFVTHMIKLWMVKGIDDSKALDGFIKIKNVWEDKSIFNVTIPFYDVGYFNKNFALCMLFYITIWDCSFELKLNYLKKNKEENIYKYGHLLAWNSLYGIIGEKDYNKAFEFLRIVSEMFINSSSHIDCQYDLASCYLNGWGTEKDIEQAKYWFGKAAENGHPKAREQLDQITRKE